MISGYLYTYICMLIDAHCLNLLIHVCFVMGVILYVGDFLYIC